MKLFSNEDVGEPRENGCCSAEDAETARAVADRIGIPFYVFNFAEDFKERVVRRFAEAYMNGETPNPCIDCNRFMKFDRFLRRARELGMEYVATGHYARVERDTGSGRFLLKKGLDGAKDQSYVLYAITQEQLRHTVFPLGGLTKTQVRKIAREHGFPNANKSESQDICFVRRRGYADFIKQYAARDVPKGRFTDADGNDLGEHRGVIHYTVGQRKGLRISSATPLYVCAICTENNTVVVGPEETLYAKTLLARDINLIATERLDAPLRARAKIRYAQPEQPATVRQLDADTLRVEFDSPQRAITKGQAVVLYDGETVVGGGTISGVGY
jgi:tRNA-specific 2-thiouridylase